VLILIGGERHYGIAENFRGKKLSRNSRFCGYTRKFSPRMFGAWRPLARQKREFSPRKSYFSHCTCPCGGWTGTKPT